MENPIKMDDLGVPLFSETPIYIHIYIYIYISPRCWDQVTSDENVKEVVDIGAPWDPKKHGVFFLQKIHLLTWPIG